MWITSDQKPILEKMVFGYIVNKTIRTNIHMDDLIFALFMIDGPGFGLELDRTGEKNTVIIPNSIVNIVWGKIGIKT